MADNKENRIHKSSIEREQSQTCLNSTERENIKGSKNLNVPHLRFPEFRGEWESSRLSSFAKKITKKNKGNIISNVLCNSANFGIIPQSEYFDRGIANTENTDTYYIIENGDFVYNPRKSVTAPYGPVNMYKGKNLGIISPLYLCFTVKDISKDFLLNWFKGNKWHRYVYSHGDTGVRYDRVSIKDDIFLDMPINIPVIAEQEKISKTLNLLEERIATQNKVIEDLKKLKSAIAEAVFNNMKGHLTNLSTICNIVKGKQVNGEELSVKGKYYVMNGGITPSGYYDQCNTPANTISISEGGNSCGYVQYNKSSFWSGGHCYTLQDISSGVETQYLFHYLKRYESNIMKLRIGTGLPNIQKKDLENFRIVLPPSNVQKEIATCLTAIEHKILVEINWLDSVQKEKQHLLHQMFI